MDLPRPYPLFFSYRVLTVFRPISLIQFNKHFSACPFSAPNCIISRLLSTLRVQYRERPFETIGRQPLRLDVDNGCIPSFFLFLLLATRHDSHPIGVGGGRGIVVRRDTGQGGFRIRPILSDYRRIFPKPTFVNLALLESWSENFFRHVRDEPSSK